jgi:hypothetical protein
MEIEQPPKQVPPIALVARCGELSQTAQAREAHARVIYTEILNRVETSPAKTGVFWRSLINPAPSICAGKKDAHEVLVQGGVLEDLGRYLVQQHGIPKKYIEVRSFSYFSAYVILLRTFANRGMKERTMLRL